MTKCNIKSIEFSTCKGRKITGKFSGGDISSDGGVMLLRGADTKLKLTKGIREIIPDKRNQGYCDHSMLSLLRQRIYGLALGYEDVTDHNYLRKDVGLQTAVGEDELLASGSTLSRLENSIDRASIVNMNKLLVETFIKSFSKAPKELILDFDATDDEVHGHQEFRFYHGYYREYCYLPLYVFCGEHLLVSYLRPSNWGGGTHTWAILALLVKRLRQEWPEVRIIFRGDSAFCKHKMFNWCDKNNIYYITTIGGNNRLQNMITKVKAQAKELFEETGEKQRLFTEFYYAAKTWTKQRKVIAKAEHTAKGENPRFIVTNLPGEAQYLYDEIYCARGDMENRIKEQQLDLFADRTSCHKWWANNFRLMLSSFAYTLLVAIKNIALKGTELSRALCGTIRLKLFKIGTVIIRNTRKVKFLLSSSYPYQDLFIKIANKLFAS
jgi:hypothetical protein